MGLVNYSDSETSDVEDAQASKAESQLKPSFAKVVDRSNPHKIRVQLPKTAEDDAVQSDKTDEPPSKRPRMGGGAFSGFNALLPAPKRTGQKNGAGSSNTNSITNDNSRKVSGPKISLKTGAAPAFERKEFSSTEEEEILNGTMQGELNGGQEGSRSKEQPDFSMDPISATIMTSTKAEESKERKATIFKPLSVGRQPPKKTKSPAQTNEPVSASASIKGKEAPSKATIPPRVSLFSLDTTEASSSALQAEDEYKPMYDSHTSDVSEMVLLDEDSSAIHENLQILPEGFEASLPTPSSSDGAVESTPATLDAIADDLGLSKAARRQLFGRQGTSSSSTRHDQTHASASASATAIKVINFNTDQEYAANEALRAQGETVQQNPVRAIAPGKHSLKQLVSAAHTQRDALEEHFAAGRRNKKEAGSRYGW